MKIDLTRVRALLREIEEMVDMASLDEPPSQEKVVDVIRELEADAAKPKRQRRAKRRRSARAA